MITSETRILAMVAGWFLAFYGVTRRSWPGTIVAIAGLGLAEGAILIPEKPTALIP